MNQIKIKSSLLLACGLAFVALPQAFAEHNGKHSDKDMFKTMDADHAGSVSRAEHAAHAKQMFTDSDRPGDGRTQRVAAKPLRSSALGSSRSTSRTPCSAAYAASYVRV